MLPDRSSFFRRVRLLPRLRFLLYLSRRFYRRLLARHAVLGDAFTAVGLDFADGASGFVLGEGFATGKFSLLSATNFLSAGAPFFAAGGRLTGGSLSSSSSTSSIGSSATSSSSSCKAL